MIKQVRYYEIMPLDDATHIVDKDVVYNFKYFIILNKRIYFKCKGYFVNFKSNEKVRLP